MVKPAGPDVYSATYSNIPVYEYQFGEGLKEHVMRRRSDNWINATHILKAAGFDKPARTRILEREVQKDRHEKVQGGYGKYQGTWVPLEHGEVLAHKNNVYDKLRMIFEYHPGEVSPPPAPKHTTAKPKLPKKPAVPKFAPMAAPSRMTINHDDYDDTSQMDNDSIADDTTVASAYGPEDDRYDMSQQSTGHRKRKRILEEQQHSNTERDHVLYADELLDYFMLSTSGSQGTKPEPPINFQPDWIIDTDAHTALHWAAAMGDVEVMKELRRFNANPTAQNVRGETPLMRCVLFTNCLDKQTMPVVVKDLIDTIDCVDFCQATVLHHAAALTISRQKHQCARYYLDIILNKMQEVLEPSTLQRILDARDVNGNTAVHIAAKNKARKCVRALIGRGANTNIPNQENVTAEELIQDLNESRKLDRQQQGSSSPYGPDSRSLYGDMPEEPNRNSVHHISEAAMSIESHITPMIIEKFQDLANSFDDELVDKETSEKEARRILKSTIQELESMRAQILETSIQKESTKTVAESKEQLAHLEKAVTALIEAQQKLQLWSRSQHEESKSNGHMNGEDDLGERIMLAKMLTEESKRRKVLVGDYRNATSMAGAGENGERYQQLLRKCLGKDSENMEENIDVLVEQLVEDLHGQKGETVLPDGA